MRLWIANKTHRENFAHFDWLVLAWLNFILFAHSRPVKDQEYEAHNPIERNGGQRCDPNHKIMFVYIWRNESIEKFDSRAFNLPAQSTILIQVLSQNPSVCKIHSTILEISLQSFSSQWFVSGYLVTPYIKAIQIKSGSNGMSPQKNPEPFSGRLNSSMFLSFFSSAIWQQTDKVMLSRWKSLWNWWETHKI